MCIENFSGHLNAGWSNPIISLAFGSIKKDVLREFSK